MISLSKKLIILLMIFLIINENTFAENEINSATITSSTLKAFPNCVHFKLRGTCYWEQEYTINTTPYVEHYLPDVVVSVFNKPGDNVWFEMNNSIDKVGAMAEQKIVSGFTGFDSGSGQHSFINKNEQNVFFKEADVVGNPALAFLSTLNSSELLLPSTAQSLTPYYQSMIDSAAWRGLPQIKTTIAEEAYAMVADVVHHVGVGVINWGGIYPHEGKVATSNDAKASAVIAQRTGDLITSSPVMILGHIFMPLSNVCGQECMATPVQENSDKTLFQMIYPVVDDTCDYFGKTIDYGNEAETKTNGSYVWVIWRFYSGCQDGNGKYIGKVIIN